MKLGSIALVLGAVFAAACAPVRPVPSDSGPWSGPYKHAPLAIDRQSLLMRTEVDGAPAPVVSRVSRSAVVHWAFATGRCGDERWGEGIDTERFARANVDAFVAAGQRYVVSTGGEGGQFLCDNDAGMERFIARYASPMLAGIDLDIEAGQTEADIDDLVRTVGRAMTRHPGLRFSFTLPTHAGTEPPRGLNALGERVMAAIARHRLQTPVINLMVMNYGPATAEHCVLAEGEASARCDMGRSAAQAARNVAARHGLPLTRVAVTLMPGVNDVVGNVTSVSDARRIAEDARRLGLAGVHHWSLDRDRPCGAIRPTGASPVCSGLDQRPGAFQEAIEEGLR